MKRRSAFIVATLTLTAVTVARGGHELPIYPSYYPHEIELAAIAPEHAAGLVLAGKLQAYVGRAPRLAEAPADAVGSVESLGSYVVLRVHPSTDRERACALAETVVGDLAGKSGDLIVHPYPVTPFHGDYLHHVDLAEAARARVRRGGADPSVPDARDVKVKAGGELARSLVRPEWLTEGPEWDMEIAEVGAAELIGDASIATNGWLGPAWIKAGWFHAFLLLGGQIGDQDLRNHLEGQFRRLQASTHDGAVERINLERSLVAALADGCHVRVMGYTVKREYFRTVFTAGIENIAYDSIAGLNSPMFIRTVKLKDFPWNGWLALGIDAAPTGAWNPIAGFTDDFGRLMWSAVGDPAMIPSPYESAWMFNRISDVQSSARP